MEAVKTVRRVCRGEDWVCPQCGDIMQWTEGKDQVYCLLCGLWYNV